LKLYRLTDFSIFFNSRSKLKFYDSIQFTINYLEFFLEPLLDPYNVRLSIANSAVHLVDISPLKERWLGCALNLPHNGTLIRAAHPTNSKSGDTPHDFKNFPPVNSHIHR